MNWALGHAAATAGAVAMLPSHIAANTTTHAPSTWSRLLVDTRGAAFRAFAPPLRAAVYPRTTPACATKPGAALSVGSRPCVLPRALHLRRGYFHRSCHLRVLPLYCRCRSSRPFLLYRISRRSVASECRRPSADANTFPELSWTPRFQRLRLETRSQVRLFRRDGFFFRGSVSLALYPKSADFDVEGEPKPEEPM